MPLPLPWRKTTLQLWNNANKPIKAQLAVLVGSLAPLVLILRWSILSCLHITTNHPRDIWKRHSLHSTTSTLHMIMAYPFLLRILLLCTPLSVSLLPPMLRPTKMLFLPSPSTHPQSLRIVMPVGAPRLVAPLPTALSFYSLSSAVWTAVSSFATGVLLVGLANARNVLPLVLVKQKFGPQMPHQGKLSTFVIFVEAFLIPETFSPTYLNQLFSTTTMMLASDGHTKWLPRLHATFSFRKTQFGNGCRIKPSMFNTSLAKSIRLIFLLKRWGTAHISGVFGIFSCHVCLISSTIHFWQSITPISNLPNKLSHLLRKQYWQFIPILISLPSHLTSSSFCCTFTAISHFCSAGCQLLRNFHRDVPPHLI